DLVFRLAVEFVSTAKTFAADLSCFNCLIRRCHVQFGTSPLSLLVAGHSVSSTALCLPARTYSKTGFWHWLGLWDRLVVCRRILALYLDSCLWRYQCISQRCNDPDYGAGYGSV